jgi:ABC-type phosphate/phosphonate transport system substrate-binding protein
MVLAVIAPSAGADFRIGFLARNSEPAPKSEFQATVDHLNRTVPEERFTLVPLAFEQMEDAVKTRQIHFLIANPLNFVNFEGVRHAQAIATLQRTYNGKPSTDFGGVIFTLCDAVASPQLSDLKNKQVAAVSERSFGGFKMQMLELKTAHIEEKHLKMVWAATHDAVIETVRDKKCAFGFVRTGTLEQFCDSRGLGFLQTFKVISKDGAGPYAVSTELYPEWPFIALTNVDDATATRVAGALLAMPAAPNPMSTRERLSWAAPRSYAPARQFIHAEAVGGPHLLSEATLFGTLAGALVLALVIVAEIGRRRLQVTLSPRNFLTCVITGLSPTLTVFFLLLLIGSAERAVEALLRAPLASHFWASVAIAVVAFVLMALASHAVAGKLAYRGEMLRQLHELLRKYHAGSVKWEAVKDYGNAHRVTDQEMKALESQLDEDPSSRDEPPLADLEEPRPRRAAHPLNPNASVSPN